MRSNAYAVFDEFGVRVGMVFAKNADLAMVAAKNEWGSGKSVDRITFQSCDGCGGEFPTRDLIDQGEGLRRKLCDDCNAKKE